jgi:hypothetical protein
VREGEWSHLSRQSLQPTYRYGQRYHSPRQPLRRAAESQPFPGTLLGWPVVATALSSALGTTWPLKAVRVCWCRASSTPGSLRQERRPISSRGCTRPASSCPPVISPRCSWSPSRIAPRPLTLRSSSCWSSTMPHLFCWPRPHAPQPAHRSRVRPRANCSWSRPCMSIASTAGTEPPIGCRPMFWAGDSSWACHCSARPTALASPCMPVRA